MTALLEARPPAVRAPRRPRPRRVRRAPARRRVRDGVRFAIDRGPGRRRCLDDRRGRVGRRTDATGLARLPRSDAADRRSSVPSPSSSRASGSRGLAWPLERGERGGRRRGDRRRAPRLDRRACWSHRSAGRTARSPRSPSRWPRSPRSALGLVLMRAGARPIGEAVIVGRRRRCWSPSPAAWLVAGAVVDGDRPVAVRRGALR